MARKIRPVPGSPPAPRANAPVRRCPKCDAPVLSREQIEWLHKSLPAEERIFLRWCVCTQRFDPSQNRCGTVYLIGNAEQGFVKVGFSQGDGARHRIADIQSGLPWPLETFALLKAPMRVERGLHRYLSAARTRGEWFRISPEVRGLIEYARSGELQRLVDDWLTSAKPNERMDVEYLIQRRKRRLAKFKKGE